ncbi:hypothetical protein [Nocardia noduli]|uniref:hypothetical protein n=1 Tax=Nocardia noduli TaxID=2815722 RepID=UPI001C217027|nr:hypothetical protein [Nocardia noduli]
MSDQDPVQVTELRDEHGGVVRVPTAMLRSGMPEGYFDEEQRAREAELSRAAISQYSEAEVRAARAWSHQITSALDRAAARAGAA